MQTQTRASLFGPAHAQFDGAKDWSDRIRSGEITAFVPIIGRVAKYHVEPDDQEIPVQKFDPPIREGSEVRVMRVNKVGNISLASDGEGNPIFFPHVNVDVEYEAESSGSEPVFEPPRD